MLAALFGEQSGHDFADAGMAATVCQPQDFMLLGLYGAARSSSVCSMQENTSEHHHETSKYDV